MHIGFIGTGSMGSILIEALIASNAIQPSFLHASNRTFEKVKELAKKHTGLHAYPHNQRVVEKTDILFLCIKPKEFKQVLEEIAPLVRPEQLIVSITSPVYIEDLEKILSAKVAKIIPSITNAAGSGASLLIAGSRLSATDKQILFELLSKISYPLWIEEELTRISSDLVSCGPAFISFLLQKMIEAAVRQTAISEEQATFLISKMMIGLGKLLEDNLFTLPSLQARVCVPGGITGEGIQVLEQKVQDMFDQLFIRTHEKFKEDIQEVKNSLGD